MNMYLSHLRSSSAAIQRRGLTTANRLKTQSGKAGSVRAKDTLARSIAKPAGVGVGAGIGVAAAGVGASTALNSIGDTGKKGFTGIILLAIVAGVAVWAVPKIAKAVK